MVTLGSLNLFKPHAAISWKAGTQVFPANSHWFAVMNAKIRARAYKASEQGIKENF